MHKKYKLTVHLVGKRPKSTCLNQVKVFKSSLNLQHRHFIIFSFLADQVGYDEVD